MKEGLRQGSHLPRKGLGSQTSWLVLELVPGAGAQRQVLEVES